MSRKIYFTFFNYDLIPQFYALYLSIQKFEDSRIIACCLDQKSFNELKQVNLENASLFELSDIISEHFILFLKQSKSNRAFFWTLTPVLIKAFYERLEESEYSYLIYLDCDTSLIATDGNIVKRFEKSKKHVFITPHFFSSFNIPEKNAGRYCVQYLIFKLRESKDIIENWQNSCQLGCDENYTELGIGDQQFLTLWQEQFENRVYIAEDKGEFLAPWNINKYGLENGVIYHYQGFKIIDKKNFKLFGTYDVFPIYVKLIYHPYAKLISEYISAQNQYQSNSFKTFIKCRMDNFLFVSKKLIKHLRTITQGNHLKI